MTAWRVDRVTLPRVAWDNAALAVLERTLDDSANRRVTLAEAFLAADEIVEASAGVLRDLRLFPDVIARNLATASARSPQSSVC